MATKSPGRRSKEFSLEFETAGFNKLLTQMVNELGAKHLKAIVRGEAAAVLYRAVKLTKKANKRKIASSVNIEKWANFKGTQASKEAILRGKKILDSKRKRLAEKYQRIGAAADGFAYIARRLGLKPMNANQAKGITKIIKNPPKVNGSEIKHRATGGREVSKGKGSYGIEVYYGNPVGRWAGAKYALNSAIRGRKNYFRRNLKEGVFKRAKTIVAKYPGIQITPK